MSSNLPQSDQNDLNSLALAARERHQSLVQIRLRVPKKYHREPVISKLSSDYQLEVNILGAVLGQYAREDGWFDLQLKGTPQQINSAMIYLSDLDIEVWRDAQAEIDGW